MSLSTTTPFQYYYLRTIIQKTLILSDNQRISHAIKCVEKEVKRKLHIKANNRSSTLHKYDAPTRFRSNVNINMP